MKKPLVLWSGGVESTSLLLRLLTETDVEVVAHFIEMVNPNRRYSSERACVEELSKTLQGIRQFEYSESSISICDGKGINWDWSIQYPIGVAAMLYHKCDCVLRAGCLEDDWDGFVSNGSITYHRPDPEPGFSHRRRAKQVALSVAANADPETVAPYLEWYKLPKYKLVQHLGPLAEVTWSCRTPIGFRQECGKCHSCKARRAAFNGTSAIPEVAEMISKGELL